MVTPFSSPGGKLNMPLVVAPIHSPRSFALAKEVLSPTMRVWLPSCWCAIVRIRDTMTCTMQSRTCIIGRQLTTWHAMQLHVATCSSATQLPAQVMMAKQLLLRHKQAHI